MALNLNIHMALFEKKWTYRDLEAKCGVSRSTISRCMKKNTMNLENLKKVSKGLGIPVNVLIK